MFLLHSRCRKHRAKLSVIYWTELRLRLEPQGQGCRSGDQTCAEVSLGKTTAVLLEQSWEACVVHETNFVHQYITRRGYSCLGWSKPCSPGCKLPCTHRAGGATEMGRSRATLSHKHLACSMWTSVGQGFKRFPPGYDRQEVALLLPNHSTPSTAHAWTLHALADQATTMFLREGKRGKSAAVQIC